MDNYTFFFLLLLLFLAIAIHNMYRLLKVRKELYNRLNYLVSLIQRDIIPNQEELTNFTNLKVPMKTIIEESETNFRKSYLYKGWKGWFSNYQENIKKKYDRIDLDSFLNITQGLLAMLAHSDESKVRELEKTLTQENYPKYKEEKVNLEKIHKFFMFFGSSRTHELKNKYQEWIQEYYKQKSEAIFIASERNGFVTSPEFVLFVYNKILE